MSTPGVVICPACRVESPGRVMLCPSCGCGLTGVLRPGTVVGGRYEVFNPLGRGGMGIVYRAHDRVLDEPVAMKVLRSDFDDSTDLTQRFRAEIKLARKVSHRNVCRIHEYGEDGTVHYICMELVSGTDLRSLLKDHRMPLAEAYDASIQVALGLEAIHEMGVIHRDLKTSNIMKDHRGVVRLMDFGIAKQWGTGTAAGVTLAGQIIGTPEYMSPEQARGEKIDLRSDIYSLGIVLFEIFTGHVPFHAPTPLATIFQHLQSPPPLSGPEAEGIPVPLIPVLHRALAKDPAQRYQNAAELVAALRQARAETLGEAGEPVTPRPSMIDRTLDGGPLSVPFPTPPSLPGSQGYQASTPTPIPSEPATVTGARPTETGGGPLTPPTAVNAQPVTQGAPYRPPRPPRPPQPTMPTVPPPRPRPEPHEGGGSQVLWWTIPALVVILVGSGLLVRYSLNNRGGGDPGTPSPIPSSLGGSLGGGAKVYGPSPSPVFPSPDAAIPSPSPSQRMVLMPSPSPFMPSPQARPSPSETRPSPSPVQPSPRPLAEGVFQVVVRPWAYVAVDGRAMGTTPLRRFPLATGSHSVVLTHPQYQPLQRRVEIRPGETTLLEVDLRREGVPAASPAP
jgi:eukaryotic-like serine/threonine-protein kinase